MSAKMEEVAGYRHGRRLQRGWVAQHPLLEISLKFANINAGAVVVVAIALAFSRYAWFGATCNLEHNVPVQLFYGVGLPILPRTPVVQETLLDHHWLGKLNVPASLR